MSAYETLKDLRDRVVGRGPWCLRYVYDKDDNNGVLVVRGTIGQVPLEDTLRGGHPELVELIPDLLDEYEQLESANGYQDEMQEENAELHTEVQDLRDEIKDLEAELRDLKRYMAEEMRLAGKRENV